MSFAANLANRMGVGQVPDVYVIGRCPDAVRSHN
ncbi:hypothetical protein SAMN05444352_12870 [Pseudomonas japonica]|uniref:Uncharacterized protein n=1 Tax=Pseudomonas japonica TaxID=256466 RepID=A0A239KQW4_9PSED|nr:hypothetical protein SAMN05444352_12870 [Pseudomonas japonica]